MREKIFGSLLIAILVIVAVIGIVGLRNYPRPQGFANQNIPATPVTSFAECEQAGNPIRESHPRQCRTRDGQTFVEELVQSCKNLCGDGVCQEIVCEAIGCPCAETVDSCPGDCSIDE